MPRFFIEDPIDPSVAQLTIKGADFHHIRDVLRLRSGDLITICDGASCDLTCRLEMTQKDSLILTIIDRQANNTEPPYRATLYQGLAKGEKMDIIIQKAVELGAAQIVPVACRRSVVRSDDKDIEKKRQRWQRIAAEAAKQCGRGLVPNVGPLHSFADAVKAASQAEIRLIPWEGEREGHLRSELDRHRANPNPAIGILIGPEGGFDADEISLALASGFRPITLGRRILRTETAGAAVLAMLIYALEQSNQELSVFT